MKVVFFTLMLLLLLSACGSDENLYLLKFEVGDAVGYVNTKGDTVVPAGKYAFAFTDTIREFGMVINKEDGKIMGIDQRGTELYEVFKYDNGPDYSEDGIFRIIKDGKIGYANEAGTIIIEPSFKCAYPFEGDFAKVSDECETTKMREYVAWESDNWYQIDKTGKRVKK